MHKYLRAAGFSNLEGRPALEGLLNFTVRYAEKRSYIPNEYGEIFSVFTKEFAPGLGLAVCGEFKNDNHFIFEYYFPYVVGKHVSSCEDITVERHSATESFAGICDDSRLGITMIFYLQNIISYLKNSESGQKPIDNVSVSLSALALKGCVVLPIAKTPYQERMLKKKSKKRAKLINSAKKGNENAIEALTLQDMDIYSVIGTKSVAEDILTLVDNYFMPSSVESDKYKILAEIQDYELVINKYTQEPVYILTVLCNGIKMNIGICKKDLIGEPAIGRRFKGEIWLQGLINFPEEK
ncbi:DUF3881 family protein [Butyrivibrio sp. NC3005]|uniref:DUF3881 family protein n=1 Tax=Butyrivibrio sp. NC3005 TaxID=1280685 RepID=UPI000413E7BD|nr:DUF3881 family protein [Butyrivibrio sp. NC3005]